MPTIPDDPVAWKCRALLVNWWGVQSHHPLGPANPGLFARVKELLIRDPDAKSESEYIGLANEIRGVLEAAKREPANNERPPARHSEDFRSVHWFGTDHVFTATQAPCIEMLWAAWENGTPEIAQATILESPDVEAKSARLRDFFKDNPAWGTMIVKGTTAGSYRLKEPS